MKEEDSGVAKGIVTFVILFAGSILICYPISLLRDVSAFALFIEFIVISFLISANVVLIKRVKYIWIYLLLAVLRFGLVCYQSTYGDLAMAGGDTGVFHDFASNILYSAANFFELLVPADILENRGDFYERMIAVVYYFFGDKTQYIYFTSFMFAEIVFRYIYKSALIIVGDEDVSAKTSLLFYIWPMEVVFSIAYLKEMQIQAVFAISIYCFIKFSKGYGLRYIVLAMLFAFLSAGTHSGMIAVVVSYFLILGLYDVKLKAFRFNILVTAVVFLVFTALVSTPVWETMSGRFSNISSLDDIALIRGSIVGSTDYIAAPQSGAGVILQTPLRFVLFILSPLPWHITSMGTLIALALDGMLRYWVLYRLVKLLKIWRQIQSEYKTILVSFFIIWIFTDLVFSWGTNNYGTAMRHRLKIFPMEVLMFYAVYKVSKEQLNLGKASDKHNYTGV